MKRTLALILLAALALGLCACAAVSARETDGTEAAETAENAPAMPLAAGETTQAPENEDNFDLFESIFLPMAKGEIGYRFDDFTTALVKHRYTWYEEGGVCYADDLLHPDNYIALMRSGEKISQLMYHRTVDGVQRAARVSFAGDSPRYYIRATAFHDGVEVLSPRELQKYITNQDLFSDETPEGISNGKMIDILSGNGVFYCLDLYSESSGIAVTVSEFCAAFSAETGVPAAITRTAAVDLDGDGVKELLLGITVNDSDDYGTLVLHDYGKNVVGHLFSYRQLYDVKEDGSFRRSGSASESGPARLAFDVGGWSYAPAGNANQDEKDDLRWFDFPREDYSVIF